MKQFGIIFILLLLCTNIKTYACFDDEDDYLYGGTLPNIDIYPNHHDDNNNDEDDYNWDDDEDWSNTDWEWDDDEVPYQDYSQQNGYKYHIPSPGEKNITTNLPVAWRCQDNQYSCVVTCMEYLQNILEGTRPVNDQHRYKFESLYAGINSDYDPSNNGANKGDIEKILSTTFNYEEITQDYYSHSLFEDIIDEHNPILTTIDWQSGGSHEIVIVGYETSNNSFVCIDPTDGTYKDIELCNISSPTFVVSGVK